MRHHGRTGSRHQHRRCYQGRFGGGIRLRGVGDAAIAGARLAGAHTIIAVDIDDRKLEWAKEFGATHTINASQTDPVEAIRKLTGATVSTWPSRRWAAL